MLGISIWFLMKINLFWFIEGQIHLAPLGVPK